MVNDKSFVKKTKNNNLFILVDSVCYQHNKTKIYLKINNKNTYDTILLPILGNSMYYSYLRAEYPNGRVYNSRYEINFKEFNKYKMAPKSCGIFIIENNVEKNWVKIIITIPYYSKKSKLNYNLKINKNYN